MKFESRFLLFLPVAVLVCSIAGCGGGQAPNPAPASHISVSVSPKTVPNLPAGSSQAFTATVTGTSNQVVTWSVEEGASCGSITGNGTTGNYSAPNSPGLLCHVVARSQADTSKTDTAEVTISPISMSVQPFQVQLGAGQMQVFSASVQGTNNPAVTWSVAEGSTGGSISDLGAYTAPQTLGTFHVVATSQADSRFTASAEVDVVSISVTISPQADTLGPLATRTFSASVVGTNQSVSWSTQEGTSGGSITQQGVYTAPQTQGSFHVIATSLEDPSKDAVATITVVPSGFLSTGPMATARAFHTATLLGNKKVLIVGGCEENDQACVPKKSAELFDPLTGTFSSTGDLAVPRTSHTATLLPGGNVLVAGGSVDPSASVSAELYDAATGTFAPVGNMVSLRHSHTATLLPDGKVLLTGGDDLAGAPLSSAELYDPSNKTFTPTGSMEKPRVAHTATLLANGKVLVNGGYTPACAGCIVIPDATAELYDPSAGVFTPTGSMPGPLAQHSATLLTTGLVLVAGGDFCGNTGAGGGSECAAEDGSNQTLLYDPASGTFAIAGTMAFARIGHTATLLSDGKVLMAGGLGADVVTFTAELYDPTTGLFTPTGSMVSPRISHAATFLANGAVLVTGGCDQVVCSLLSAELYK